VRSLASAAAEPSAERAARSVRETAGAIAAAEIGEALRHVAASREKIDGARFEPRVSRLARFVESGTPPSQSSEITPSATWKIFREPVASRNCSIHGMSSGRSRRTGVT